MKKYTREDIETFEIDSDGYRRCPAGDYSEITTFGDNLWFEDGSILGSFASFGRLCVFGANCQFGVNCLFGGYSIFGSGCTFADECRFGEHCTFNDNCTLGDIALFGAYCDFNNCTIGERACFGPGCEFKGNCIVESCYWPYVYPPPFTVRKQIELDTQSIKYWEERLGREFLDSYDLGYYFLQYGHVLLKRPDLSACDRMIINSWIK